MNDLFILRFRFLHDLFWRFTTCFACHILMANWYVFTWVEISRLRCKVGSKSMGGPKSMFAFIINSFKNWQISKIETHESKMKTLSDWNSKPPTSYSCQMEWNETIIHFQYITILEIQFPICYLSSSFWFSICSFTLCWNGTKLQCRIWNYDRWHCLPPPTRRSRSTRATWHTSNITCVSILKWLFVDRREVALGMGTSVATLADDGGVLSPSYGIALRQTVPRHTLRSLAKT